MKVWGSPSAGVRRDVVDGKYVYSSVWSRNELHYHTGHNSCVLSDDFGEYEENELVRLVSLRHVRAFLFAFIQGHLKADTVKDCLGEISRDLSETLSEDQVLEDIEDWDLNDKDLENLRDVVRVSDQLNTASASSLLRRVITAKEAT